MLQKELIKRLKGKYETKMDDKGWLNVYSDGIPLCRVKYNGNCIINDDENLSDEYREKIADIQDEVLTAREYIGLYEHAPQMKAEGVSKYRQLAVFSDTVLAAINITVKNGGNEKSNRRYGCTAVGLPRFFMIKFFFASFVINFNRRAFIAFNNTASVNNIKSYFAEFP